MKQKNFNPVSRFPLQSLLVFTLGLLLAISLCSFFRRNQNAHSVNNTDPLTIEQMNETKKHGNKVVGFASVALTAVVMAISTGLSVGRRPV